MKICIMGPPGAGKSTIANSLANALNISSYEFDEIYWDLSGSDFVKNSEEFIMSATSNLLKRESWIIEGAYDKRLVPFLLDSWLILKIEVPYSIRVIRLFRRFIISRLKKELPKETLWNTIHLVGFSYTFNKRLNTFFKKNANFSKKTVCAHDFTSCLNSIRTTLLS